MKFNLKLLSAIAASALLAGCMSMPISTMYKMSQFSPFDMEPQDIRIAIRTDSRIEVNNGAAQIYMSYSSDGNEVMPAMFEEYSFNVEVQRSVLSDMPEILLDDIEDNEHITILKLSDDDANSMKALLVKAKKYKASDAKGSGQFGLNVENNCFGNLNDFESLEVDVFLQAAKQDGYMLFLEDVDVIEEAKDNDVDLQQTNKCEPS